MPTRKAVGGVVAVRVLHLASMGPRRCRRGRAIDDAAKRKHEARLQWGRVVADAEGRLVARPMPDAQSFNGAASLPTRKDDLGHVVARHAWELQWGRVVADAEGTRW